MTKVAACAVLVLGLGCAVDERSLKLRGDSGAGDRLDAAVPSDVEVVQPMADASCTGTHCPGDCVLSLNNDSHNCGRCNYECAALGVCDTGSCRILSMLNIPGAIAVDTKHVYWLEPYLGESSVNRATLDGSESQVLASDTDQITALAVDSSYAYWVAPTRGVVMKVALDGGDPIQVATIEGPQGIAIDANNLYVTSSISAPTVQGSVLQIPKAGGPVVTLVPMLQLPRNIAVNATHVYWTDFMSAGLGRALIQQGAGGGSELIVTQYGAHGLALGKDYAYWGFLDNGVNMGGIGKIHLATKVKTSLASNVRPGEIAADANHVYWIEVSSLSVAGKSKIMRVAVGGGASELLWTGETPRDIALDETSVYWTVSARSSDLNKGSLWKHAK